MEENGQRLSTDFLNARSTFDNATLTMTPPAVCGAARDLRHREGAYNKCGFAASWRPACAAGDAAKIKSAYNHVACGWRSAVRELRRDVLCLQ
jgi:hypothetical protein